MNQYLCLISAEVCTFEMLKPLEILLIEEMVHEKGCYEDILLTLRFKGWWRETCTLHKLTHDSDSTSLALCKLHFVQDTGDRRVARS